MRFISLISDLIISSSAEKVSDLTLVTDAEEKVFFEGLIENRNRSFRFHINHYFKLQLRIFELYVCYLTLMMKTSLSLSTCKISITCLLDDRHQTYIKYILHQIYIQNIIYITSNI